MSFGPNFEFKFNLGFEPFRFMPPAGYRSLRRLSQRVMEDKIVKQAGPSIGKLIATSGDSGLVIEDLSLSTRGGFPSAIAAGILLTQGKWYYEVSIDENGLGQLGWADMEFVGDSGFGRGVGDDKHSWAFDGQRVLWWHNDRQRWGKAWTAGDILGCAIDMDKRTMSFSLNGSFAAPMGLCFSNFQYTAGIVPALTLQRFACTANWGQTKLRFPPPDADYRSVWEWIVDHRPSLGASGAGASGAGAPALPPASAPIMARGVSTTYTAPALPELQTVPLRVANGYGKCTVTGHEVSNSVRYATVTTDRIKLSSGRWYYELTTHLPTSACRMCVGWVDRRFRGDWTRELGVGDDSHSWGLTLPAGGARHAGATEQATATRIRSGAVIGLMCDIDAHTISVSVDGRWLGDATAVAPGSVPVLFNHVELTRELAPAVSFVGEHASASFNFGEQSFVHMPDEVDMDSSTSASTSAGASAPLATVREGGADDASAPAVATSTTTTSDGVPRHTRGVHFSLVNPAPQVIIRREGARSGDGDGAAAAAGSDEWDCAVCTFKNPFGSTTCSMCGVPKQ